MEKIRITLCCGTYCHVMGGAELQQLKDVLPTEILENVELKYSTCLGVCKDSQGKPPFAQINDTCVSEATVVKIIHEYEKIMEEAEDGV